MVWLVVYPSFGMHLLSDARRARTCRQGSSSRSVLTVSLLTCEKSPIESRFDTLEFL